MDNCRVKLQIWDTAGQERFRSMAPMYYRGAAAALLVYDVTRSDSFDDIEGWIQELRANGGDNMVLQIFYLAVGYQLQRYIFCTLLLLLLRAGVFFCTRP